VNEKPDDFFQFSLMLHVIGSPRLLVAPNSHSHRQTIRKFEDVLVRFIVADEEQPRLTEMDHEGMSRCALPS